MEIVIAILGSSATATIISGIFNIIVSRKKTESGLEAGVRILLYDRIKHLCTSYIQRDKVTHDELEDLIKMHTVYHNSLAGNGFLDELMEQVKRLPRE